jgi:uncharacterized protein involved in exopolysaccharide biosynthesis
MIGRFLETFFRHKVLIMMPIFLIPIIVTPFAFTMIRPYFESYAVIWVSRPTYLRSPSEGDPWSTPAQIQSLQILQMLRTRAFIANVAKRTDLAPLLQNERGEAEVNDFFAKNVTVTASNSNLVVVGVRADRPQLTVQVINAVIDASREEANSNRSEQAGVAISFYESRAQAAADDLAKATAEIRRYVAANPRLTTVDPSRGAASTTAGRLGLPPIAIDPQLAELIRRVEVQQSEVDRLRKSLDDARMDTDAAAEVQDSSFRVMDPPRLPGSPVSQRRRILLFPAAGMVVGLGISMALLVGLAVADRAIRVPNDLPTNLQIAAVVPSLKLQKLPKQFGPDTTRRAMAFVAGAALPAPRGAK